MLINSVCMFVIAPESYGLNKLAVSITPLGIAIIVHVGVGISINLVTVHFPFLCLKYTKKSSKCAFIR